MGSDEQRSGDYRGGIVLAFPQAVGLIADLLDPRYPFAAFRFESVRQRGLSASRRPALAGLGELPLAPGVDLILPCGEPPASGGSAAR